MKKITEKQLIESVGKLKEYLNSLNEGGATATDNLVQQPTQKSGLAQAWDWANKPIWGDKSASAEIDDLKADIKNTSPTFPVTSNVSSHAYNSSGDAIGELQTYLNNNGFKGQNGNPLTVDKKWGKETGFAAKAAEATLAHSGDLNKLKELRTLLHNAANTANTAKPNTQHSPATTNKPSRLPAHSNAPITTAPITTAPVSGDPALDARISDNSAYFKMTPEQRKAADAAKNSGQQASNPVKEHVIKTHRFTNNVDEIKYYSQILKEQENDEN